MERREISFTITHDGGTPTRQEVRQGVAAVLKTEPSSVLVLKIEPQTGLSQARGTAYVYEQEIPTETIEPRLRWKLQEPQPQEAKEEAKPKEPEKKRTEAKKTERKKKAKPEEPKEEKKKPKKPKEKKKAKKPEKRGASKKPKEEEEARTEKREKKKEEAKGKEGD